MKTKTETKKAVMDKGKVETTVSGPRTKLLTGLVVSDKPDKCIVVEVAKRTVHPVYKKHFRNRTHYMAHDAKNEAKTGDTVEIRECRPLSARKRFMLEKIILKATTPVVDVGGLG